MLTIYHNPRCSKSRQTLKLIEDANAPVTIVEYLKTPLDHSTLSSILTLLKIEPRAMMRTKEIEYKEQNLNEASLSSNQLIQAIVETPKLLERPIVVAADKACIGRPPENVLALL